MDQNDFHAAVVAIMWVMGAAFFGCLCLMSIESMSIAHELTAIREALMP